jgi:hypothetical protein
MGTTYVLGKNVKNKMISLFQEATYTLFSLLNLQISFNKESMMEIDTWLKNLNYPSLSTIYSSIFNGITLENGILILPYNNAKLYIDTKETLEV